MKTIDWIIVCEVICLIILVALISTLKDEDPTVYEPLAEYTATVAGDRGFGIAITRSGTPYVWTSEIHTESGITRTIVGKPQKVSEICNAVSVSAEKGVGLITTADGRIYQLEFIGGKMAQYALRRIPNIDSAAKAEAPVIRSTYYDYCYAVLFDGSVVRWNPYDEDIIVEKVFPAGKNILLNGCVINSYGEITDLSNGFTVKPSFEVQMIYDLYDGIVLLSEEGLMYEVDFTNGSINRIANKHGFRLINYERNVRYDGVVIGDGGEKLYDLEHVIYIDNNTMVTADGRVYQAQDSYKSYDYHDGSYCYERNCMEVILPEKVMVQNMIEDFSYNISFFGSESSDNDVYKYLIIGQ